MPIVNGYATLDEFRAWNEDDTTTNAPAQEKAIEAASRWVDSFCERHFWQDANTPRIFDTCNRTVLDLGTYGDLVALTALAVDLDGDGAFETAWAPTDYQLLPLRPAAAPEPGPYTSVRALGGREFPAPDSERVGRIQITGTWGWPAVPAKVHEACLIQASRLYKRRYSPEGVTGFGSEFGPIRLTARPDPDAVNLLAPYRLRPVLVA